MFGFLKSRDSGPAFVSDADKETIPRERAQFNEAARQTVSEHQATRAALLKAGGAQLAHQPGYEDRWETAIRRLVQTGELRELVEYGGFGEPRTYRYVLTPAGERAAATLAAESRSDIVQPSSDRLLPINGQL